ncbi:maltotransferase domain-containing protein, partial [Acidiphilium sp.]|uniref:alpha-1,4-glucan--maltose-1-phosphate maltosyltransferase n=1 Tax=Acidiphilium sp. TaxID=527 RepID=UPI003CFBC46C
VDRYGTFADELAKKHEAGLDVRLELVEGRQLLDAAIARAGEEARTILAECRAGLERSAPGEQVGKLTAPAIIAAMRDAEERRFLARREPALPIDSERRAAGFASWYEIFPRSQSGDADRHGTFDDVIAALPRIRAMGFDVLYFPPIHPIGGKNRKGPNNTLVANPGDPGSPYAIGGAEGGHDAIHPELGSFDDFRRLISAAAGQGLEIALDFAIQCAPDHPWLAEHPEWFDWRPDGSIKYAENPPKKYQDIVNVDFYADGAQPALWHALRDIVLFWIREGIRIFRVDNPHTKPFPFWEWLIADIRRNHPDVIFLSEAFTRPKIMHRLAKIGFSQSYTYFTWRNSADEMKNYIVELTQSSTRDYFRPHFFVNTPDINPAFLQTCGRPGFLIRAALAATLSGLWGVYNGFELCEAAAPPGTEEYLDSEKYQIRSWDYGRSGNIVAEISLLNRIRRQNPALQSHLGVHFIDCDNDNVLCFEKASPDRSNIVLVAISFDPRRWQTTRIDLPLERYGSSGRDALHLEDLMRGVAFTWHGRQQVVDFDPGELPFSIWRIRK